MSLKIKIDLKQQKIYNSSKMSDKENAADDKGNDITEESQAATSDNDPENGDDVVDSPQTDTADGEATLAMEVESDDADSYSDTDDLPLVEAVSDSDEETPSGPDSVSMDACSPAGDSTKKDAESESEISSSVRTDVTSDNIADSSSKVEDKETVSPSLKECENTVDSNSSSMDSAHAKNSDDCREKSSSNQDQSSSSPSGESGKGRSNSGLKAKTIPASKVQADFSDNEESMEIDPGNKLLEVIFKEDEENAEDGVENVDVLVPDVQCRVDEPEESEDKPYSSATGDKGTAEEELLNSNSKSVGEEGAVLTAVKKEPASVCTFPAEENTNISEENEADVTSEGDTYADDETMQTYAKEFLYSDTSSLGPEPDALGLEDGRRLTLSRFPRIAKTIGSADYTLLQEVYKVLYLRNPWDTKEVLSARILDFSGFNFSQESEDYFNREVILRGMAQKSLEAIANLLCLVKPISARSNKQRVGLAMRIMKFLKSPEKPKRIRPASNSASKAKAAPASASPVVPAVNATPTKPIPNRSRKSTPFKLVPKSIQKESENLVYSEKKENASTAVPERNISPGKMKWSDLKLSEVKVTLTKIDIENIKRTTNIKINTGGAPSSANKMSSGSTIGTPSTANKMSSGSSIGNPSSASKMSSGSSVKTPKKEDVKKVADKEASVTTAKDDIKKLKEFPEVLSNIEGTPEKILSDIHYLLYLEDASLKDLKSNVMEFRGFPVEDGTTEIEERRQFLDKMSDDIIKNLANTFYLKSTYDKEDNIELIIKFLKAPSKRYMKEAAEAPDKMLLDRDNDLMDGLSDSDDSITCEVVTKKVDCIDLISSGDEAENDEKPVIKQEKQEVEEQKPTKQSKRCLHDFETITKIVNTHPHEYLIDIYNLLYLRQCEPSTLRKEILEFTGFEFEKGSEDYVKRKQYLDRMQYNNVRRIFNTVIHNTRDVRVFSKPTMISEIFQFLFKLPETDTSVRPPPPKSSVIAPTTSKDTDKTVVNPALLNAVNKAEAPPAPNNARLSELKRVFQRVACFPCEYLVDVHKLLFMKDCDMKDIRQNIFAFKGFTFGVDSAEFKQRKMYLEYLTFHSLRKISSVLTTKNVDLRNSTKHELSTHLTKVLTEYTNTYMEQEAQEASSKAEEITAQANKAAAAAAEDPNVEKIVVTPVIEGFQAASTNDSTLPKVVEVRSQSKQVQPKNKKADPKPAAKSTTTPAAQPRKRVKKTPEKPLTQTFEKIIIPTVDQPAKQRRRKSANPTHRTTGAEAVSKSDQMGASAMQFQDIHLPEVENLVRSYQQNPNLLSNLAPHSMAQPMSMSYRVDQRIGGHRFASPLSTFQIPLQMSHPHMRPSFAPPNVTVGLPPRAPVPFQIIRPFSMQPPLQNLYYNQSILNSSSPPLEPIYKDEDPVDYVGTLPVECILTEGGGGGAAGGEPAAKKPKLAQLLTAPPGPLTARNLAVTQPVQPVQKVEKSSAEGDSPLKPSTSFHLKIRDAMTKASEDEEDCDKPLATLVGHPNDKVLKQQICDIVEKTDLQEITMNGVIQKIFSMYPKYNLNYRKEFVKSTLRSLLYRLGEQEGNKSESSSSNNPDSSVATSEQGDTSKSSGAVSSWSANSTVQES